MTLYKVTAKAPDLIQRTADNQFSEDYVHYIAKPKAHEGDVYYNFNELVKAMQANPTGTFKLGSNMNATNVQPVGKSYVTITLQDHYLGTSKVARLRISCLKMSILTYLGQIE